MSSPDETKAAWQRLLDAIELGPYALGKRSGTGTALANYLKSKKAGSMDVKTIKALLETAEKIAHATNRTIPDETIHAVIGAFAPAARVGTILANQEREDAVSAQMVVQLLKDIRDINRDVAVTQKSILELQLQHMSRFREFADRLERGETEIHHFPKRHRRNTG